MNFEERVAGRADAADEKLDRIIDALAVIARPPCGDGSAPAGEDPASPREDCDGRRGLAGGDLARLERKVDELSEGVARLEARLARSSPPPRPQSSLELTAVAKAQRESAQEVERACERAASTISTTVLAAVRAIIDAPGRRGDAERAGGRGLSIACAAIAAVAAAAALFAAIAAR